MTWEVREGDALERLREMPAESVQCCVTSPPYYGLRDYGTGEWEGGGDDCDHKMPSRVDEAKAVAASTLDGSKDTQGHLQEPSYRDSCGKCGARRVDRQIGLEQTPDEYVAKLVDVFREVRRVLRADGTLWLNIGDSYAGGGYANHTINGPDWYAAASLDKRRDRQQKLKKAAESVGIKPKDLLMIPAQLALALRADGWWLRSDIIWSKPNPMPESVTDRPTNAYEHVFLLAKSARYFYDADAIR